MTTRWKTRLCVMALSLCAVTTVPADEKVWEEGILVLTVSPVFDAFLFDHHARVLTVYFRSGEIMEYRDVPCDTYQSLMNADERVTWFSDHIYRAFPCRRIASAFRPKPKATQPHPTEEMHHAVRQSSHSCR